MAAPTDTSLNSTDPVVPDACQATMHFIHFDFHDSYFIDRGFYKTEDIEARFEHALTLNQSLQSNLDLGSFLTLEQSTIAKLPTEPTDQVLLQIIQIMPHKVEHHQKDTGLILHEMVVALWALRDDSFLGKFSKGRFHLTQLHRDSLFIVLDKPVNDTVLHLNKKKHLGLLLDMRFMDQLISNSKALYSQMRDKVELGYDVYIGMTLQQAMENWRLNYKATCIRSGVFGEIDHCFISLG